MFLSGVTSLFMSWISEPRGVSCVVFGVRSVSRLTSHTKDVIGMGLQTGLSFGVEILTRIPEP